MPLRLIISLLMFAIICLAYVAIALIEKINQNRLPTKLRALLRVALAAVSIFAAVDLFAYMSGYWPLPRMLQLVKSIVLWVVVLIVMGRLVQWIYTYRSSIDGGNHVE